MTIIPRCHICNDGKAMKWNKCYKCCGCKKYICPKHHNPKKMKETNLHESSFCTACNPKDSK